MGWLMSAYEWDTNFNSPYGWLLIVGTVVCGLLGIGTGVTTFWYLSKRADRHLKQARLNAGPTAAERSLTMQKAPLKLGVNEAMHWEEDSGVDGPPAQVLSPQSVEAHTAGMKDEEEPLRLLQSDGVMPDHGNGLGRGPAACLPAGIHGAADLLEEPELHPLRSQPGPGERAAIERMSDSTP